MVETQPCRRPCHLLPGMQVTGEAPTHPAFAARAGCTTMTLVRGSWLPADLMRHHVHGGDLLVTQPVDRASGIRAYQLIAEV
jgi:hypothetical protein